MEKSGRAAWIIVFFLLSACWQEGRLLDQLQTHGSVITGDARCVRSEQRDVVSHTTGDLLLAKQEHGIIKR